MKKIHVTLVSKEALPVFYMINEFTPDFVYLVGTKETASVMKHIGRILKQRHISFWRCMTSADNMVACADVCEQQIHAFNGDDCEYCYNLTGGTKLMAFGAMKCAERHGAKIVYTDTKTYVDLGTMERKPITNMLDMDTIIALQGQKVKEKTVYRYDAMRTECAEAVRDFVNDYGKIYGNLLKSYNNYKREEESKWFCNNVRPEEKPNELSLADTKYYQDDQNIVVEYDGIEVFRSDYEEAFEMLFEGRWWETLVADSVAKWAGNGHEIWVNVKFEPNSMNANKEDDKNEIDVLVNRDNSLLFVECKSGKFDQNNIYKLSSVCKTYGSYKSKGCIIEFKRKCITPNLLEKANEDQIKLIVPKSDLNDLSQQLDEIVNSLKA